MATESIEAAQQAQKLAEAQLATVQADLQRRALEGTLTEDVRYATGYPRGWHEEQGWGAEEQNTQEWAAIPYSSRVDNRENDRFQPYYLDEEDLQRKRAEWRNIAAFSAVAIGANEARKNYVLGTGFSFEVTPDGDENVEIAAQVQNVVDQFNEDNEFEGLLDAELFERSSVDGEAFVALFPYDNWRCQARIIEPEQVVEPQNPVPIEEWKDFGNSVNYWWHGVHTQALKLAENAWIDNATNPLGYHVVFDSLGEYWDYIPAHRLEHIKRNVPQGARRGVSDYMAVLRDIELEAKLRRNTGEGAAVQAAIAFIRQHSAASNPTTLESFAASNATGKYTQQTSSGGSRDVYTRKFESGTVLDLPSGLEYQAGPLGQNQSPIYVEVAGYLLRAIGVRWSMPEYIISSDASNANFACHDEETECLTHRGWLRHDDLATTDFIATMDADTERLEWQRPIAIHRYAFSGDMVRVKSRAFDLLVTPNHRMLVSSPVYQRVGGELTQTGEKHPWDFVRADQLADKHRRLIPSHVFAEEDSTEVEAFRLPGVPTRNNGYNAHIRRERKILMLTWVRFLGWWISEGHAVSDGKRYKYSVGLNQNDGADADDVARILAEMPSKWHAHKPKEQYTGKVKRVWNCCDKGLWTWLRDNCGTGSYTKRLPDFVWSLPLWLKQELLETLCLGDGEHRASGSRTYFTVSLQLADDVQRLGVECGCVANRGKTMANGVIPVSLLTTGGRHRWRAAGKEHVSQELYEGTVWCATVPNGTMITRRNGKVAITGNSTLVSESPFVKAREREQAFYERHFRRLAWKAVLIAWQAGKFALPWAELQRAVSIEIEKPDVATRDRLENAQEKKLLSEAKIISKRTWATEAGYDYDEEQKRIAEEPQPAPPPQLVPGQPLVPGQQPPQLQQAQQQQVPQQAGEQPQELQQQVAESEETHRPFVQEWQSLLEHLPGQHEQRKHGRRKSTPDTGGAFGGGRRRPKQTMQGEFWLEGGQAMFADGDIGDFNHEGMAMDAAMRDIIYSAAADIDVYEYADADVDWEGFEAAMEEHGGIEKWAAENDIDQDTLAIAQGFGDPRLWAADKLGWIRVDDNNVQMVGISGGKMKELADGLYDAYGEDVEKQSFDIEVVTPESAKPGKTVESKTYWSVPYLMLDGGRVADLRDFLESLDEHAQHDQKSHGRRYGRKKQTDTPAFKKWFGDSQAVDDEGNPLVLFHGTTAEFDEFENPYAEGLEGDWHMFSSSAEYADQFTLGNFTGANIKPVYIKAENPLDLTELPSQRGDVRRKLLKVLKRKGFDVDELDKVMPHERDLFQHIHARESRVELVRQMKERGIDSIIMPDAKVHVVDNKYESIDATTWVVFSPTQIKSATGNVGTFDPDNPKITESLLVEHTPGGHEHDQKTHGRKGAGSKVATTLPKTNKEAASEVADAVAEWIAAEIERDPERFRYDKPPTREEVEKNWLKYFRARSKFVGDKGALNKLDGEQRQRVVSAMKENATNDLYSEVVRTNYTERVIFQRAEKGRWSAAEFSGQTTRVFESPWMNKDIGSTSESLVPGKATAGAAGGLAAILRHEYGHGLFSRQPRKWRSNWSSNVFASNYKSIGDDVTSYAAKNDSELFCELFALRTDKNWDAKKFKPWVIEATDKIMEAVK